MKIGYTMMSEQSTPRQLVTDLERAEDLDFDFSVISDHYFPWLDEQGHSPYAWSVLGAAAQATSRIGLMTFVTCPTMRYHPAIVAQKAATMGLLSDGRFTLGLGAGENLNEHVIGRGWPSADVRHVMLTEAIDVIGQLFDGQTVTYTGQHITVDSARLWDLPAERVPVAVAASGSRSVSLAAHSDGLIAVSPDSELVNAFEAAGGTGKPVYGQLAVCYGRDSEEAAEYAARLWPWSAAGWKVMAELPGPQSFAAYSRFVRPEDIRKMVPCGPDPEPYLAALRGYEEAGFTHLALVQVGADRQSEFFDFARAELLPALRAAAPAG
jgi:G6PDH family F420-dependent oxidoreductase